MPNDLHTSPPHEPSPPSRSMLVLAAVFFLAVALLRMHGVWEDPSSFLLVPNAPKNSGKVLNESDQRMVLATITDNARRLVDRPTLFRDSSACHPFPRSFTLGEHMFNEGLLAALPLAISGEPILSYNIMLALMFWLAGLAMFAFCFSLTRSIPAALVAGLLFEIFRPRLADTVHPYVVADVWTVLALLFLYRLFARGNWWSALGLAFFGVLQLGESLYPVCAAVVLLGVALTFLAIERREVLLDRLPKLIFCAAAAGLAAWWLYGPYLATAGTWDLLEGRVPSLLPIHAFLPGSHFFPGMMITVLAAIGLLDRLRGPRGGRGGDPRIALFFAGALLFWLSVIFIPIPYTELRLWSPTPYVQSFIPGLSAVRATYSIYTGAYLAMAVLAGYGVLAMTESLRHPVRLVLTLSIVVASLAESAHPRLAQASFGSPLHVVGQNIAIPPAERRFLRSLGGATVLEYPPRNGNFIAHAHYLRMAVEHGGRTSACYNSFGSPMAGDVTQLALALPDPAAADALAALGFEVVLVHADKLRGRLRGGFRRRDFPGSLLGGGLREIGRGRYHAALALEPAASVVESWSALSAAVRPSERADVSGPDGLVRFRFHNGTSDTFRHPAPVEPSPLLLRWVDPNGNELATSSIAALLPLAIGPGGSLEREITVPVMAPAGEYTLKLSRADRPGELLAASLVRVVSAPPGS